MGSPGGGGVMMGASDKKLTKWIIFGYGLGHVCNDICASMWFTYLLLFFQKVCIKVKPQA